MMNPDIDPLTGQPRVQGPSRQMYVQPTSIQGGYADQIAGQNLPLNNPVPGMYQEKKARRIEGKLKCASGYYRNDAGECVKIPDTTPPIARKTESSVPGMYQEEKARMIEKKVAKTPIKESFQLARAINASTGDTTSWKVIPTGKKDEEGFNISKNIKIPNEEYDDYMKKQSTPQSAYETPRSVSGNGGSNLAAGVVKSQINPGNEVVEELKDAKSRIPGVYKNFS